MILILPTLILAGVFWYLYHKLTFWQRQGVPTPGLLYQWHYYRRELGPYDLELLGKLGPVYGTYEGLTPILIVADPDLVREVLAKQFQNFPNHKPFSFGEQIFDKNLFLMKGDEDWKRVRSIVSPSFTSGKLRVVEPKVYETVEKLKTHLKTVAKSGEVINVRKFYNSLSLGIILRCAYGVQVDILEDPLNPIMNNLQNLFSGNWASLFSLFFPKIARILGVADKAMKPHRFFENMAAKLIHDRKNSTKQKSNDFLQLMMDASQEISKNPNLPAESAGKGISDIEMMAQALIFLLAGFDTTSTIMACTAYHLAKNPEVQRKLVAEVAGVAELNHDSVNQLRYLNAVLKESFRLSPPFIRMERQCVAPTRLGNILVPAGAIVSVPVFAMQRDPNLYTNPEIFNPDRFLEGGSDVNHHEYAHIPFGGGPRLCVAQRFAMMETKMALAQVCQTYSFEATTETKLAYAPASLNFLAPTEILLRVKAHEYQTTEIQYSGACNLARFKICV